MPKLAEALDLSVASDERARRRAAKHSLEAGRVYLHRQGVLPWAIWPDGVLPEEWWTSERFVQGVEAWALLGGDYRRRARELGDLWSETMQRLFEINARYPPPPNGRDLGDPVRETVAGQFGSRMTKTIARLLAQIYTRG